MLAGVPVSAPSGANKQPWAYVIISNPGLKARVRTIIEREEQINYERRMGPKWLDDLKALNTSPSKPYLTAAPYLIAVFKQVYNVDAKNQRQQLYYSEISVSISVGILLAAIQVVNLWRLHACNRAFVSKLVT